MAYPTEDYKPQKSFYRVNLKKNTYYYLIII